MKLKIISLIIITTLALSACANATPAAPTPDIQLAYTSAAKTVVAEFTLTAAVFSPTPEPSPTQEPPTLEPTATQGVVLPEITSVSGTLVTVTPTPIPCDAMSFDPLTVDVDIPDGTTMSPGQEFVKTWKIKNVGSCVWGAGYGLIYSYGEKMTGVPQILAGVVEIGQEAEVKVSFKAPDKVGEYISYWIMANPRGFSFGKPIYVKILVK